MAYSAHKTAIPPPPSPSPYSRLPTPAGSHFGRPGVSRSVSSSNYGTSHPSPSRPNLPHQSTSYDSFATQPCPSPSPSKLGGLGLSRHGSTVEPTHKRRSSVAEKAKLFEKLDDNIPRSPSTANGFGFGQIVPRHAGGIRRESMSNGSMPPPRSSRISSRPPSYVDTSTNREVFNDIGNQLADARRPSQLMGSSHSPMKAQAPEYGSQASPASMRKSLGLLGGQSQAKENSLGGDEVQLVPPPPSIIRQFSSSSSSSQNKQNRGNSPQPSLKAPSPPPQIPTPSPRKGTHIRAQSHGVTSLARPPPRPTSTRPIDARPTSTVSSRMAAPPRPTSTLNTNTNVRPRAASHYGAPNGPGVGRISTPANDLPLPKGSRTGAGRVIAPPRSTSSRPNEPVAPSSASLRRPGTATNRPRPASSHVQSSLVSASKGSDSEPSIRSESVASNVSNNSSVRSDVTTKPKPPTRAATVKASQDPQSPQRSSPIKGHRKNASVSQSTKPTKPAFNNFKTEYPHSNPVGKPTTASLMQSSHAPAVQAADIIHAQTRLLQFSILHTNSFESSARLQESANNKLYRKFSNIRERNSQVAESHRREQELVDLHALSLVFKRPAMSNLGVGNWKDKLSGSPEEAIQSLAEQLSKVLAWFSEGRFEGDYTRMIRIFEDWISLPDTDDQKIYGLGTEYGRDIIRVRRKMEMALRGLEGWMILIIEGEKGEDGEEAQVLKSSLGRVLKVAIGRLKAGLDELIAIQNIEKTVVTTIRKELRKKLGEMVEVRKELDIGQEKKELAAWAPIWTT